MDSDILLEFPVSAHCAVAPSDWVASVHSVDSTLYKYLGIGNQIGITIFWQIPVDGLILVEDIMLESPECT